ncbi:TetR family transcriptional regulator [Paramixta manurensis]|uniref:TetR family transcriptional regulator n=1 Tax=Paramixta manurensis TaxID=2740817 RepID=A0A6M8UD46_9GAMM|nr:TetR family transcriptional regulator [Erwiniaceae bacterium PD-1]
MARPLSEEKRVAILNAAVAAVAELGVAAPTAKIARDAGVGDGTLFVYFANKEVLFNQLYLHIKCDLRAALQPVANGDVETQLHQFWDRYINWGITFPNQYKATRALNAWDKLTEQTRQQAWALFPEFDALVKAGFQQRLLRVQPKSFLGELIDAIANMVLELSRQTPQQSMQFSQLGWENFWRAIRAE